MMYYPLEEKAILLREEDDVAVAKQKLEAGTVLVHQGKELCVLQEVPPGHKVALRDMRRALRFANTGRLSGLPRDAFGLEIGCTRTIWRLGSWSRKL